MTKEECIFCKIAKKEADATIIFENESIVAFKDINPIAKVHILIIPKIHITSMNEVQEIHGNIMKEMLLNVPIITREISELSEGYRLIVNTGKRGGQEVMHVHLHLIGGQRLQKI